MSAPIRFGTDGVRGPAGVWPLTPDGMTRIGRAIAEIALGPVVVGWDTRASSPALASALIDGLLRGGAPACSAGVLPTPALSVAVAARGAAAGAMITASHNPWMDNGVKVVGPDGAKTPDEAALEAALTSDLPDAPTRAEVQDLVDPSAPWRAALPSPDLRGLHVLLDCANGAAFELAPAVLTALGAELTLIGAEPDGKNINAGCGALHPPTDLRGADLGICLDGDGDRLTMVIPDPAGGVPRVLDGDDLLWLLAHDEPALPVVGTLMSNSGLEAALSGRLIRVAVGDKHVHEGMVRAGAEIGGEPSGHILFRDGVPGACGLYTALRILQGGLPLGPRAQGWTRWPSARRDLRRRVDVLTLSQPARAEAAGCRVLVRLSGTEALTRVLVEGADCGAWADAIAREILDS